jgi:hypothetical protein
VWLLEDLKKTINWDEQRKHTQLRVLAIPAEHTDRLDVYHIGENGYVWGLHPHARFPNASVNGLLDAWMNLYRPGGGVDLFYAPQSIKMPVPRIMRRGVRYQESEFELIPGPTLPIDHLEEASRTAVMKWPPGDTKRPPVSPEAESAEHYGPLKGAKFRGLPVALSSRDPKFRSLHVVYQLPQPFHELAPSGIGFDTLTGQARMKNIAKRSTDDLAAALQEARDLARPYISEGRTSKEFAWLGPVLQEKGEKGALRAALFDSRQEFASLKAAASSPAWKAEMGKIVSVRRAWGVLGLFWALLIDRLEVGLTFESCDRCGWNLSGKRGKRYCGRDDNKDCFNQRRADDRRRERTAKSRS